MPYSGYIDYHERDTELVREIIGNYITSTQKADFPGYFIARFENAPDDAVDKIIKEWGRFEILLDDQ